MQWEPVTARSRVGSEVRWMHAARSAEVTKRAGSIRRGRPTEGPSPSAGSGAAPGTGEAQGHLVKRTAVGPQGVLDLRRRGGLSHVPGREGGPGMLGVSQREPRRGGLHGAPPQGRPAAWLPGPASRAGRGLQSGLLTVSVTLAMSLNLSEPQAPQRDREDAHRKCRAPKWSFFLGGTLGFL